MADTTLFGRLKRLFSNDVIIRNVGGNQLRVIDTNRVQSVGDLATNRLVDRYTKLWMSPNSYPDQGYPMMIMRKEMFTDYEAMDTDSIISSALDIYADESTLPDEFGDILTIKSGNEKVSKILKNLFYDILNIEFNLWPWIRNVVKYGDFNLKIDITEKLGITNVQPISPYIVKRVEGANPANPDEIFFEIDSTLMGDRYGMIPKSRVENYEMAHFRLLSDTNFLPYGKSMLEGARKVWKQLTLMEDAMLIHRIMRAPEKRLFYIDVGNIPPAEVDTYMQAIISKMKKVPYVDPSTGEYNLKFNMQNVNEDFYLPVRGGETGTKIDTTKGLEYNSIEDIDYLKNRMLAALKIPKAFLGYDESLAGKSTLAAEDIRFARTISRIQRIIVSELTKIAIVHLYVQGFTDGDLVDFELTLTNPSTISEQSKIELWQAKTNLAKDMIEGKLLPKEWIYEQIFNMSPEMYSSFKELMLGDSGDTFRFKQIEEEGNDPVKTGESFGTAHDIASLYKGKGEVPAGYDETKPEGPKKKINLGRPEEHSNFETPKGEGGIDPTGRKSVTTTAMKVADGIIRNIKSKKMILDSITPKSDQLEIGFLNESNILDETTKI